MLKKIKLIFSKIGKFMVSFIASPSSVILDELGSIIYDIVVRVEQNHIGEDKWVIVKRAIADELLERGLSYSNSLINLVIEMSVLLLKDNGTEIKVADKLNKQLKL